MCVCVGGTWERKGKRKITIIIIRWKEARIKGVMGHRELGIAPFAASIRLRIVY